MVLQQKIFSIKGAKLHPDIQLRILTRLDRLIHNGYPLIEALESMAWENQLVEPTTAIINALKLGETIDTAFENARFHPTIISHLYFIRYNGDLRTCLRNCITMYSNRVQYVKKFKQVLQYPLFLFAIFFILMLFIKHSILPSFINLVQTSTAASYSVHLAIQLIDLLSTIFIAFMIGTLLSYLLWHVYKKKVPIEKQIKFYNAVPIYRTLTRLQTSFHFSIHMSMLFQTGLTMKEVLVHMETQTKLPIVSHYSHLMKNHLEKGLSVSIFVTELTMLDKQLATILQNKENLETLQRDLNTYADFLLEDLQEKVMRAIALTQPVFFIIIALFIVFIYAILMWPMFQLINTL
ncbi:competence type IV pilus assembly protein ComGB [Virgibacillus sp. W0430]|uniref:competence type IV pilus assembly protein ComGB n=1 Tax=Virgibacillus sp. W0430 TaxID=3391580 RepID=UPI003F46D8AE